MAAGSINVPQIIPLRPPKGCRRHVIDSTTEIEIISDTSGSNIYYTLNGQKPEPLQSHGKKFTFQYKQPFTLAVGKVTVKAVAVSQDGSRLSSSVTRTFTVLEGVLDREFEIEEPEQEKKESLSQKFRKSLKLSSRKSDLEMHEHVSTLASSTVPEKIHTSSLLPRAPVHTLSSTPAPHHPPPSCVHCSALRDNSTTAKYCTQCGAENPPLRTLNPLPVDSRMVACPNCRATLPPGTSLCIVCDSDVPKLDPIPKINAQTGTGMEGNSKLCLNCGTCNSLQCTNCVTCSMPLETHIEADQTLPVSEVKRTVMQPIVGSSYLMCATCGRVNTSDARYCDWCGASPQDSNVLLSCQACGTANKWQARFCQSCGEFVKCPLRPNAELATTLYMPKANVEEDKWVPLTDRTIPREEKGITAKPPIRSTGTQTQGLFYPSASTIAEKMRTEALKDLTKTASTDRIQPLSGFSPGKGLWRMQLDHICAHFKAYSQATLSFQESIGNKQLGKLISTEVKDGVNSNGDELSSTLSIDLNFSLKNSPSDENTNAFGYTSYNTNGRNQRSSSIALNRKGSRTEVSRRTFSLTGSLVRRRSSLTGIKVEQHLLSAELSEEGQGRSDIVTSLLEKGADPNSVNQRGISMLNLAARGDYSDSITVLLNHGANINTQNRRTGNTALHEAVQHGSSHEESIDTLLKRGADLSIKNKDGLTAIELASKHNHQEVVKCIAAHLGSSLLHSREQTAPNAQS